MNWSLRQMKLEDVPIFLEWYNDEELHNTANAKKFKPYSLEELTEYWREKLSRSNATYYSILLDDKVVGRAGLKKPKNDDETSVEFSIVIGVTTLHSKGLGTRVTENLVKEAFLEPENSAVFLGVRQDNKRAIRCYEKVGFQISKEYIENHVEMYEMKVERNKIY
ncbi:GNAT family N-acetyltransferase [Peribacillus acanthi]|uniref:GNAT family N-acetyltransferase n=1 Tax=Peribacillus acanthi TaxID=2171554 RepID=UPI000D3EB9C7|nr:GNAT family N-acetyltransferase [Peribacillus acanthi]